MISSLSFRFGSSASAPPLSFSPGGLTVFVGPNNSGKTLVLREIFGSLGDERFHHAIGPGSVPPAQRKIVADVKLPEFSWADMRSFFERNRGALQLVDLLTEEGRGHVDFAQICHAQESGAPPPFEMLQAIYRRGLTCMLEGTGRLSLVGSRPATDLKRPPQSHIQALFLDDVRRDELRQATKDAFGFYVLIDPTGLPQFRFCTSDVLPDPSVLRSLAGPALEFFARCGSMEAASDGVKAYAGLIAALLCTDSRVILIDEPESFLHPPLIRKLGAILAKIAADRGGNVFVSTHSADFLSGCVQAGAAVNVVRLTYEKGVPGARLLEATRLRTLMRDPLVRSTGVLSSLFYRGAAICEGDADRVFYAEINERLLRSALGGMDDAIFLNAQNWQTCDRIAAPLREMGIPAAMVADVDVFLSNDFKKLLNAAFVPDATAAGWRQTRAQIKCAFDNLRPEGAKDDAFKKLVKQHGISLLAGSDKQAAEQLIGDLGKYGVFVVPVGELEQWLPELRISGHGPEWLIPMLEKLGGDPDDPGYVHPGDGDVWDFVRSIGAWISDPHRRGVPD